MTQIW